MRSCLVAKNKNTCLKFNDNDKDSVNLTRIVSNFPLFLPYILMEYIEGYNLLSIIKNNVKMEHQTAKFIFSSIVDCLTELDQMGLNNFDLKPDNILVDKNGMIKLCDLGGIGFRSKSCCEFKQGTLTYSAPEVIEMND